MDMTPTYWEENSNMQRVKYESCNTHDDVARMKDERPIFNCCGDTNLNFSTATCSEDDCEYGPYKKNKVARQDPMSHRIIEKRRRDRMNNCLADLSRLIPTDYLKKGRGRIEKTEIIEMAIKHMKYLQQEHGNHTEHYRLGYQECMSEAMRFMVEVEGHFPREAICVRLLNHLQKHCESISRATPFPASAQSPPTPNGSGINGGNATPIATSTEHVVPATVQNGSSVSSAAAKAASEAATAAAMAAAAVRSNVQIKVAAAAEYAAAVHKAAAEAAAQDTSSNGTINGGSYVIRTNHQSAMDSDYDKHAESNGISYKYKTNIKMRFTQDINGSAQGPTKRQKLDDDRRNSITSMENQSSSHSSPPSSELCTRISDSETTTTHRRSPSDNSSSLSNNQLKMEPQSRNEAMQRYSPNIKGPSLKHNFNVPIFVLHAKGSYYIPLTIDYRTLLPFLQNYDILEVMPTMHNIVLHPVTINVNFLPSGFGSNEVSAHSSITNGMSNGIANGKYKSEFSNNWH